MLHRDEAGELYQIEIYSDAGRRLDMEFQILVGRLGTNGTRRIPASFTSKVVKALELDYDEETRLCRAVALGQPHERVKYEREKE